MEKYRVRFENAPIISDLHYYASIEKFTDLDGASPSCKIIESVVRDSRVVALGDLRGLLSKLDMVENEVYFGNVRYTNAAELLQVVG